MTKKIKFKNPIFLLLIIFILFVGYNYYQEEKLNQNSIEKWSKDGLFEYKQAAKIGMLCDEKVCITFNNSDELFYLYTKNISAKSLDMLNWTIQK